MSKNSSTVFWSSLELHICTQVYGFLMDENNILSRYRILNQRDTQIPNTGCLPYSRLTVPISHINRQRHLQDTIKTATSFRQYSTFNVSQSIIILQKVGLIFIRPHYIQNVYIMCTTQTITWTQFVRFKQLWWIRLRTETRTLKPQIKYP